MRKVKILPLPSDALRAAERKGRTEGRAEGLANMFNSMIRTMYEKGCSVLQITELTDYPEETIRNALTAQGLTV